MHTEQKNCPHKFSVEETEEGYAIHLKGDKEKLKARLSLLHKHFQAFHRLKHKCQEPEAAE